MGRVKLFFSPGSSLSTHLIVVVVFWVSWSNVEIVKAGFCRRCGGNLCSFTTGSGETAGTEFLQCPQGKCVCVANTLVADAPSWNVTWIADGQQCLIEEYGPCGTDKGLDIGCTDPGLECIENRCRDMKKLNTVPEGQVCYGQIDCLKGLVCKRRSMTRPFEGTTCNMA